MESLPTLVALAVAVFVATDVDDLFLLVAWFANPRVRPRDVVIGQYLGIGALYGASAAASLVSLVVAPEYLGLLGLAPIVVGLKMLRDRDDGEEPPAQRPGGALSVAAITIANGADNVAVYTPLFALRSAAEIALFGVVFAVGIAAWCLAAWWLVRHPVLGRPIREHAHRVVPVVFIGLGVMVLYEAGSFRLLG